MDTIDRPDSNVPARYMAESSRMPAPIAAVPTTRELAIPSPAAPQITPRVLMRGLSRHKWKIVIGWLVLTAPLIYLIYRMVEPSYEAVAMLRVEPATPQIYGQLRDTASIGDFKPYLQTQVTLVESNNVLDAALANSEISKLKIVREWQDPKADLKKDMLVEIVGDNTYLIRVSLSSKNATEAAQIVNAVVDAYILYHGRYQQTASRNLRTTLESERKKIEAQIQQMKTTLTELVANGKVGVRDQMIINKKADDGEGNFSFNTVSESQYAQAAGKLMETDLKLIDEQAARDTIAGLFAAAQQAASAKDSGRERMQSEELEDRIREEFQKDRDVQPLIEQINEAREALEHNRDLARNPSDPAVTAIVKRLGKLEKQWDALWAQKHDEIAERLQAGGGDQRPEALTLKLAQSDASIEQLKRQREQMRAVIDNLKVVDTQKNTQTLQASMLSQDLQHLRQQEQIVKSKLQQIEFELGQESYRITVEHHADVPLAPSNNKRLKYLAVAPLGVLGLMLGLFLLLEVKAERVADPDALSTRMQSEVYALPPLPTARALRKRTEADSEDHIEQFMQRLDHLRFGVCGNPAEVDKGRCVLITSAIGREGKTTLAAQLAARCGNAGMSTLLIDADMWRTGLCALLDIPEGPGLSDALLNDEPSPTDLVIPVQGGTFHLLPAGTPMPDTSRMLQNPKLGLLIMQFRQLFDMVIIDSPPVLPVPDALILGRWADGAVLAVRYDISRFPQVERARRRLDGAGIAVLGTVINGMKNSESYYGRYSYGRKRPSQADSSAAL